MAFVRTFVESTIGDCPKFINGIFLPHQPFAILPQYQIFLQLSSYHVGTDNEVTYTADLIIGTKKFICQLQTSLEYSELALISEHELVTLLGHEVDTSLINRSCMDVIRKYGLLLPMAHVTLRTKGYMIDKKLTSLYANITYGEEKPSLILFDMSLQVQDFQGSATGSDFGSRFVLHAAGEDGTVQISKDTHVVQYKRHLTASQVYKLLSVTQPKHHAALQNISAIWKFTCSGAFFAEANKVALQQVESSIIEPSVSLGGAFKALSYALRASPKNIILGELYKPSNKRLTFTVNNAYDVVQQFSWVAHKYAKSVLQNVAMEADYKVLWPDDKTIVLQFGNVKFLLDFISFILVIQYNGGRVLLPMLSKDARPWAFTAYECAQWRNVQFHFKPK